VNHLCCPSEDDFIALDDATIMRFQAVIRFRTVARALHDFDREQLRLLRDDIKSSKHCVASICVASLYDGFSVCKPAVLPFSTHLS